MMFVLKVFPCCLLATCLSFAPVQGAACPEEGNSVQSVGGNPIKRNLNLDEKTAIKLAEVILSSIYGDGVLEQRPWNVTDQGTNYRIVGTFHGKGCGGVAEIVIDKSDARVISFIHGR